MKFASASNQKVEHSALSSPSRTLHTHPMSASRLRQILTSCCFMLLFVACLLAQPLCSAAQTVGIPFPNYTPSPEPERIIGPPGEQFTFTRTGRNTGNAYTLAEAMVPPGSGPLPHFHEDYDEWFYFPKGGFTLFLDPDHTYSDLSKVPGKNAPGADIQLIETKPKSLYYVPRGHVHGFYNSSDKPLPMTFVWAPERITQYFRDTGEAVQVFPSDFKVDAERLGPFVTEAPKYGINQSQYFMQYLNSITPATPQTIASSDHVDELKDLLATPLS
jgi:oxalate decarboxylase/phosphoglucose isomerase-like protein (cupin superfamily)